MKIFWTKTHLKVVRVLFILLHFLWINYSLCGTYKQGQLVGTNVDACLSYCTRSNTQHPSVQFCECILVLKTLNTTSLLRTWRNTDVVGILKRPVNNTYMCQVMCRDLLECKDWHYDKRRRLCFLGNRDPGQTISVAAPGSKDGMGTPKRNSQSNGVSAPTITGMSSHRGKSSPNIRTSKRNSQSNGVSTPTTAGMSSHRGKSSPNIRTSKRNSQSNGVSTPTTTGMSSHRGKSSPDIRTSKRDNQGNGVSTPTITGMSSHRGKSSYMGTSKKNDESDDVTTPTATEISANTAGDCLTTCRQPNYVCIDKKCVCNNGFSATTDGKCVKGCSSFKDSFTELQTGLCMRKFEKKYTNHGINWCRRKCLRSDFECAFFEIYDKGCLTIKWKLKYYQPEFWVRLEGGCKHYTRDCNHKGSHCDVCDGPQYRCRDNKCVCSRGYSFVVEVGTCVGECVSYAHSFTKQSTHNCLRKYKRKYREATAKICEDKCRHEKKFTCGAFHIYKGNCYTMEWDMTLLEKTWERKEKGCEQYMRDCKPNCEMGYNLIPGKNRCVRDCKVYSTKFQKQSNVICYTGHNKKLRHAHRKECERACLKYKKTCDGYELYKNNCYIIAENKIYDAEWKVFEDECTHYQRICKE